MPNQQQHQSWSVGQPSSSAPSRSSLSYPTAQPRPSFSKRRLSRVHFNSHEAAANPTNQPLPPQNDPYNPKWQNAIYDPGVDSGKVGVDHNHRPSAATLVNNDLEPPLDHLGHFMDKKPGTSFSSDKHLVGVQPPPAAYTPGHTPSVSSKKKKESRTILERRRRASISTCQAKRDETLEQMTERLEKEKRRGLPVNHRELYGLADSNKLLQRDEDDDELQDPVPPEPPRPRPERATSEEFNSDVLLDERDPRLTAKLNPDAVLDRDEIELERLKKMTFAQRMSEKEKDKIRFHIVSIESRHIFLITLSKALMKFGAPSHRIEAQLKAAATILDVTGEFIQLPGIIVCCFQDEETQTSETHWIKSASKIWLGNLQEVHEIYRGVVHDERSAKDATAELKRLLKKNPIYSNLLRCIFAFSLSALICPLAFGGSFLDLWIAGSGAFVLCFLQLYMVSGSPLYASIFEISIGLIMSFTARGLSSIQGNLFCYTAITSSSIIGILPGYLILSSSLELASKNIVCGSVRMVYSLMYTLFLGFGLQIGSEIFLVMNVHYRHRLASLSDEISGTATILASFLIDNSTVQNGQAAVGTYQFTDAAIGIRKFVVNGCYRPAGIAWYLQAPPFWAQFLIVPTFSIISSLANLQPYQGTKNALNLFVMVVISSAAFATNKIANHYIFNRSDIVSAIGAFTAGILGNLYSRRMGGTAFTSMVTGVLFLVPSGLSAAGGITGDGSGIDIGGAMIAVTIGVTVGLFMSQAIVYAFGSKKNAAVMSF